MNSLYSHTEHLSRESAGGIVVLAVIVFLIGYNAYRHYRITYKA